jgi:hypothetical protein
LQKAHGRFERSKNCCRQVLGSKSQLLSFSHAPRGAHGRQGDSRFVLAASAWLRVLSPHASQSFSWMCLTFQKVHVRFELSKTADAKSWAPKASLSHAPRRLHDRQGDSRFVLAASAWLRVLSPHASQSFSWVCLTFQKAHGRFERSEKCWRQVLGSKRQLFPAFPMPQEGRMAGKVILGFSLPHQLGCKC